MCICTTWLLDKLVTQDIRFQLGSLGMIAYLVFFGQKPARVFQSEI